MLTIKKVLDQDGNILGVEIGLDGAFFFIALDQDLWPGIRAGRFPIDGVGCVLYDVDDWIMLETMGEDNEGSD
jgi:hypothetical protein